MSGCFQCSERNAPALGPRARRGGSTPSSPAATVLNGNLGLFVRGTDSRLYVNWLLPNNHWTGWCSCPAVGSPLRAPAATVLNGNLGLFVRGTDSRLYVNWLLTNNHWTGWGLVPGGGVHPFSPCGHRPEWQPRALRAGHR